MLKGFGAAGATIHLAATRADLGLQHLNQVTERIDHDDRADPGGSSVSSRLDGLIAQPGRSALSTFRLGHPVRTGRRSPRRPSASVLR
ncbi:MAG: hypothetical protein ABWX96_19450 [Propionibacteriaceae bacterium]